MSGGPTRQGWSRGLVLAGAAGVGLGCGCGGPEPEAPPTSHANGAPIDTRPPDPRYDPLTPQQWPATLAWNRAPVDLSHLNAAHRPAGVDGRVRVQGDALVFGDGRPARFWGTNLVGDALFEAERDDVVDQARRLAAFGFNLVRIHHQDSAWVVPNVFGRDPATTRVLDEEALTAIDWWIACLEEEGIYVWLDLHVGREFLVTDGITDYAELLRAPTHRQGKGFAFVNASIEARMQETARAYLGHENRFTGRRYLDDPGLLAVLLTNENDLTFHFGALVVQSPRHGARYEEAAEVFAQRHDLDATALLRPWEPGPAQWLAADLEAGLFSRAIADLRPAIPWD